MGAARGTGPAGPAPSPDVSSANREMPGKAKGFWHRLQYAAPGWLAVPHAEHAFSRRERGDIPGLPDEKTRSVPLHGPYRRSAFGTARLSSPASKYSAWEKSNTEAMMLDGMDWILLLYIITESL